MSLLARTAAAWEAARLPRHHLLARRCLVGLLGLGLGAGCGAEDAVTESEGPLTAGGGGLALTQAGELHRLGLPPLGQPWRPREGRLRASAEILVDEVPISFSGVPASSFAYNWGIVADVLPGHFLAAVRVETLGERGERLANRMALTTLDSSLRPLAPLSFVEPPRPVPGAASTAEDPRLIRHDGQLYIAYNMSMTRVWTGPRTMHLARLRVSGPPARRHFALVDDKTLIYNHPDDQPPPRLQKNWSPFSYGEHLCFLYRSSPSVTLCLSPEQLASTQAVLEPKLWGHGGRTLAWDWGMVRGGTPALYLPEIDRYGTFFHSSQVTQEPSSKWRRKHYYTGFATFMPYPPFELDQAIEQPLISPLWLMDMDTAPHHIVFVQGVAEQGNRLVVSYGRNDHSAAALVLDRHKLLQHLSGARVHDSPGGALISGPAPERAPKGG